MAAAKGLSRVQLAVAAFGVYSLFGDVLGKSPIERTREKWASILANNNVTGAEANEAIAAAARLTNSASTPLGRQLGSMVPVSTTVGAATAKPPPPPEPTTKKA
jgi:hypothetical protein